MFLWWVVAGGWGGSGSPLAAARPPGFACASLEVPQVVLGGLCSPSSLQKLVLGERLVLRAALGLEPQVGGVDPWLLFASDVHG